MHQRQPSSSEEYPNEDEYPDEYPESDDPELYNDVEDDDLLLHDEDFPSDGDGNILDEDFIHENRYDHHHQQQVRSPPQPTRVVEQRYNRHPHDIPVMSSSPEYVFDQSQQHQYQYQLQLQQQQQQQQQMQQQQQQQQQMQQHANMQPSLKPDDAPNANDFTAQLEDCLFFDPNTIESFIKFHRAQIREVTEFSKKETKLLANFSLGLSSRREDERQSSTSLREELKTSSEFIGYLDNLDEVLEMKTAAIEALRDRIRHVLGEEEL